jgi:hypothetical protein
MVQELTQYIDIHNQIEKLFNQSKINQAEVISLCGFSSMVFYIKLKEKDFSPKELINLIKYLAPNDYLKLKLQQELQQAEQDIINHKTKPALEVIDSLRQNLF